MLKAGQRDGILEIIFERKVLRAVIDKVLIGGENARSLNQDAEQIYKNAMDDHKSGASLKVSSTHLPEEGFNVAGAASEVGPKLFYYEE